MAEHRAMRSLLIASLVLLACGTAQAAAPAPPLDLPTSAPHPFDEFDLDSYVSTPAANEILGPFTLPADLADLIPAPHAPQLGPRPPLDAPTLVAATTGSAALILLGLSLYSRLAKSELLDHKRRETILALIRASPGIPLTEIAHKTGLAWGTSVYHLERLERASFIVSEKTSGRRCYFPVGTLPRESRAGLGALQQETTREVANFIAARPGATQTELCQSLGLSASAASKQVSKLENAGLLRRERAAKNVTLHPDARLESLLAA